MRRKIILEICVFLLCGCSVSKREPHAEIEKLGYDEGAVLRFENVQSSRISAGTDSEIQFDDKDYTKACDQKSCVYVKKEGKQISIILDSNQETVKNDRFAVVWESYHEHEAVIMADHIDDWVLMFDLAMANSIEMQNEVISIILRTVDRSGNLVDTTYTTLLNEKEGMLNVEFTESTETHD